jgi:hypothetical protein
MTDAFDPHPGRPDHPDFWKLSDVILQQDGKTEDEDFDLAAWVSEVCDLDVVFYMAMQRGLRMGVPPGVAFPLWLDAFMAGAAYAKKKASEDG